MFLPCLPPRSVTISKAFNALIRFLILWCSERRGGRRERRRRRMRGESINRSDNRRTRASELRQKLHHLVARALFDETRSIFKECNGDDNCASCHYKYEHDLRYLHPMMLARLGVALCACEGRAKGGGRGSTHHQPIHQ